MQRERQLQCDLLVVGGGINGAGIARDAAGRGLKVLLAEKDDLGEHTSSSSTKLVHGGLRYLEHYEFGLVRKSLAEREVLLRNAPHIVRPLRFLIPHDPSMRPVWMIRIGLFLYDHLARREILPGSQTVDLRRHEAGAPLKEQWRAGIMYSDGWVDDARLVVLNALDAAERGATVLPRTRCTRARREGDSWVAELQAAGGRITVNSRALVNAAGPWAASFLREAASWDHVRPLRLVKGSHIVVRKLFDHPYAYIFQNPDKRIVFAIPFERDFTLIGTTDVEIGGDPGEARADAAEIDYLCTMINRYFSRQIAPADVVWTYSGVRPLLDDGADASSVTRDYKLELDTQGAPLLSVWGGKLTTYRALAEEAVGMLARPLGIARGDWTATAPLPGGDLGNIVTASGDPMDDFESFCALQAQRRPWLPASLLRRYAHAYGTRIERVLGDAAGMAQLGEEIAPGLHAAEVEYLIGHEWAQTVDDILWRRSKLGLHLPADAGARLGAWLAGRAAGAASKVA
ncbi:MAG: glpD2 [Burkholderiaceae bacterium]|nr:glpD2 [Burkholderiaceae bacterium]